MTLLSRWDVLPRVAVLTGAALGLSLLLDACSKPASLPTALPAPGEMRVLEAVPVEAGKEASLIPNGSFEEYYAGSELPTGPYKAPAEAAKHSTVYREGEKVADGRYAIMQEWSASDWGDAAGDLFGLPLDNLNPNTAYRFEFRANTLGGPAPHMMIYLAKDDGGFAPFYDLPVQVSDAYRTYTITFNPGTHTKIRIASLGPANAKDYPAKAAWDAWRLVSVPGAPVNVGPETATALLPNGSFDVWFGRAPGPQHWNMPRAGELRHSIVLPQLRAADDTGLVAHQAWRVADTSDLPPDLFGNVMGEVKPNRHYKLSFDANTREIYKARIEAYGIVGKDSYVLMGKCDVPPAKDYKTYTFEFDSRSYAKILFVTRCPFEDAKFPNHVLWDNWRVEDIGASTGKQSGEGPVIKAPSPAETPSAMPAAAPAAAPAAEAKAPPAPAPATTPAPSTPAGRSNAPGKNVAPSASQATASAPQPAPASPAPRATPDAPAAVGSPAPSRSTSSTQHPSGAPTSVSIGSAPARNAPAAASPQSRTGGRGSAPAPSAGMSSSSSSGGGASSGGGGSSGGGRSGGSGASAQSPGSPAPAPPMPAAP